MPTDPVEDLRMLTATQCKILYWVCKGLKYWEIGNEIGYETYTVQYHMTLIYSKLGLDRLDREARRARLFQTYCPILLEQISDPKRDCEKLGVPEEEPVEPEERVLGLVEEDERAGIIPYGPPDWERYKEGKRPSRWRWLLAGCILGSLGTMLTVAALFLVLSRTSEGGAFLGARTPTLAAATPTGVLPVETPSLEAAPVVEASPTATEVPSPIATPSPTPTSTFTPTPSQTPAPTAIPTITATPSVYQVGDRAFLAQDIFFTLSDELHSGSWCGAGGFKVDLLVENRSSRQFIVRFERQSGFTIRDDEGRTYEFEGTSSIMGKWCRSGLENVIMDPGDREELEVVFAGPIPPSASYLLITIDDISGQGPFVFRKEL